MAVDYQPRHARRSDRIGPEVAGSEAARYVGRHRDDRCTCNATGFVHEPDCRLLGDIVQRLSASASTS